MPMPNLIQSLRFLLMYVSGIRRPMGGIAKDSTISSAWRMTRAAVPAARRARHPRVGTSGCINWHFSFPVALTLRISYERTCALQNRR
jgi:hypothetical protein